ncbi:MAG: GxxExxY protein [Phycisphaerae bacterium]
MSTNGTNEYRAKERRHAAPSRTPVTLEQNQARIVHRKLSYDVVGCAQRVHSSLGPGLPESVYKRAIGHELAKAKIPFASEVEFEVCYDGIVCGTFRADLVIDSKIIVEPKAVESLCDSHRAQTLTYLRASGIRLGLLVNFGETRLKVARVVN